MSTFLQRLRLALAFLQHPGFVPVAAGLFACGLFLVGLNNHALWDYHEPYVGGIIHEMATWGNWVVPTLNGEPYLEKPPLFYLMGVLTHHLAGSFEPWVLRLPSAVMAVGTVVWVSWLGCRLRSGRTGLWAGLLVATHVLFFQMGHRAVVDMTFTATVTLSLGLAFLALAEEACGLWIELFWASQGLVFLAKGVIGPVLVLWAVAGALAFLGDRSKIRAFLRPGWGMAAGLALALAWVVPLTLKGGREFLTEVFLRNTLGRFFKRADLVPRTGVLNEHRERLTFYLERTPGNVLPWVALWLASLGAFRKRAAGVVAWGIPVFFLAVLILLSASSGKRMVYLLPVLPITFLHTALWLDSTLRDSPGRFHRGLVWTTIGLALILGAGLPWFVVARVGMAWPKALGMCVPALLLGSAAVALAARGRMVPALGWTMAQWMVTLLAFLIVAVPELDREWNPLLEPYREAKKLEDHGVMVFQGQLSETQVGFINLTFGHTLSPVPPGPAALAALERSGPVALLLEPHRYRAGSYGILAAHGIELPTEASRSTKLWERAPVLYLNRAAAELLDDARVL